MRGCNLVVGVGEEMNSDNYVCHFAPGCMNSFINNSFLLKRCGFRFNNQLQSNIF